MVTLTVISGAPRGTWGDPSMMKSCDRGTEKDLVSYFDFVWWYGRKYSVCGSQLGARRATSKETGQWRRQLWDKPGHSRGTMVSRRGTLLQPTHNVKIPIFFQPGHSVSSRGTCPGWPRRGAAYARKASGLSCPLYKSVTMATPLNISFIPPRT